MRTFYEIIKYVEDEYPELTIMSQRRLSMRIACEGALDLAAEEVRFIEVTTENNDSLQDSPGGWISNDMGDSYAIDKESILKLK